MPAWVVGGWSDQGLHTRGTLEGFRRMSSPQKWLHVHGRKKWAEYYLPENVDRQRQFFDHFLKGVENGWGDRPPVIAEIRSSYYEGERVGAEAWPVPDVQYRDFFLSGNGALTVGAPTDESVVEYDGLASGLREHRVVFEDGPVAVGWLRVSHRELDAARSEPYRPVLAHQRELPLEADGPTHVTAEILPSGTVFEAGESIVLVIQGRDLMEYPEGLVHARHLSRVNLGRQRIHLGGEDPSRIVLPVLE